MAYFSLVLYVIVIYCTYLQNMFRVVITKCVYGIFKY